MRGARRLLALCLLGAQAPASGQVLMTELMADPAQNEYHDEFVELWNAAPDTVDLTGWRLGDDDDLDALIEAGDGTRLPPGAFALVVDGSYAGVSTTYDAVRERAIILTIEDRAFGRAGFPNTAVERVWLVDGAGDTVDAFTYEPAAGRPGHSWERRRSDRVWLLSPLVGGTPGRPNRAEETPARFGRIDVSLSPDPFVERLQVDCRLPAAPALLSVRIYDANGGLVARLRDWEPAGVEESIVWDGHDDAGRAVAPGLYVVSVRSSANGQIVQSRAVVARQ